jgi:hypothetical protein
MQYIYTVPVIVKDFGDDCEERELPPITPDLLSRIADDFNSDDMRKYSRDIVITHIVARPYEDGIRVIAETPGRFSREKAEKIRLFLNGQCADGWGENGFELGRYVTAHVWDQEHDVQFVEATI